MLIQNITTAFGHFNSGVAQYESIIDRNIAIEEGNVNTNYDRYRPTSIKIPNTTGGNIHVGMMNDNEWEAYQADYTISNLFPIADSVTETFDNFVGNEITKIIVSGVASESYDTDLTINVIQD